MTSLNAIMDKKLFQVVDLFSATQNNFQATFTGNFSYPNGMDRFYSDMGEQGTIQGITKLGHVAKTIFMINDPEGQDQGHAVTVVIRLEQSKGSDPLATSSAESEKTVISRTVYIDAGKLVAQREQLKSLVTSRFMSISNTQPEYRLEALQQASGGKLKQVSVVYDFAYRSNPYNMETERLGMDRLINAMKDGHVKAPREVILSTSGVNRYVNSSQGLILEIGDMNAIQQAPREEYGPFMRGPDKNLPIQEAK